jgi:hypothetical protein
MDYNIEDHTITLADGTTLPTAEACRRYRLRIPIVDMTTGQLTPTRWGRDEQPMPVTKEVLLTDAAPGMFTDDPDDDHDTLEEAYRALCDDIAEVRGNDIMGQRMERIWADFRRDVCKARGDHEDRWGLKGMDMHAYGWVSVDEDEKGHGYVRISCNQVEARPRDARRFAAAILAACDEAQYPEKP